MKKSILILAIAGAALALVACNKGNDTPQEEIKIKQLEYAGETYTIVKMKDGNWWFAENLRYLPANITPCQDVNNVAAGVYYPLVNNNGTAEFSTDAKVIKAQGYLYQTETAFGVAVNSITTEAEAKSFEGARGICPEGWHIPTAVEIQGLVGKAVSPYTTKEDAPYYDGKNGSIKLLNADNFNIAPCGAVSIANNTIVKAVLVGALKDYTDKISSGYFCGSTCTDVKVVDGVINNIQYLGFTTMTNKPTEAEYTCNGSKISYKMALPLRCVMNK